MRADLLVANVAWDFQYSTISSLMRFSPELDQLFEIVKYVICICSGASHFCFVCQDEKMLSTMAPAATHAVTSPISPYLKMKIEDIAHQLINRRNLDREVQSVIVHQVHDQGREGISKETPPGARPRKLPKP